MRKAMPWFRMYTDFLNDPKMVSLAFEDQRHFIGILALKSAGTLDQECDDRTLNRIVAQRLWVDSAIIEDVKKRLMAIGLIDDRWHPMAWDKRQFTSDADLTAADRSRRYRESRNPSRVTSRTRHGSVTGGDTETDTEAEEKKNTYTPEFEQVWQMYPDRPGPNKAATFKAWNARLKAGSTVADMAAGTERYAAYCIAMKTDPQFVKQPATFFGPDKHFESDWRVPAQVNRGSPKANMAAEFFSDNTPQPGSPHAPGASNQDFIDVNGTFVAG